jgi:hypothetical protein
MKPVAPSAESPLPWHALLAPVPFETVPRRQPVGSPEVLASPAGAAIAGWEQLVFEMSAGAAGLRVVLIVLDATGRPISASDTVLYRSGGPAEEIARAGAPADIRQESLGGRFEPGGTFNGTRWHTVGREPAEDEDVQWQSTPREPSIEEAQALLALVADLVQRHSPRG